MIMEKISNGDLQQYVTWVGWGYIILQSIFILANYGLWGIIRFIPDIALVIWEIVDELGGQDKVYSQEYYDLVYGWRFTFYISDYASQLVGMILGLFFDNTASGLPISSNETSDTEMWVFGTLAWYLKLAQIILILLVD